jgi:hypothetical protein
MKWTGLFRCWGCWDLPVKIDDREFSVVAFRTQSTINHLRFFPSIAVVPPFCAFVTL